MPTVKKQIVRKTKKKRAVKSKNVVDRIEPLSFDDESGFSFGFYGKSGTGKTTLYATFPKPMLVIRCSGSKNSKELKSIDTPANRKTIKCVPLLKSNEIIDLVAYQRETNTFKTVVLDHGSGLQDLILKEVLGLEDLPSQGSWGMAKQQEWGQVALQTKELLREILNLSCYRVIVTQERTFESKDEEDLIDPFISFGLIPSIAGWLGPTCDYVCQTFLQQKTIIKEVRIGKKKIQKTSYAKGVDFCLRTSPDAIHAGVFRTPKGGNLPEYLIDPTYDKILKLIQQGG